MAVSDLRVYMKHCYHSTYTLLIPYYHFTPSTERLIKVRRWLRALVFNKTPRAAPSRGAHAPTRHQSGSVNIRGAMHMDISSWKSNLQAYGMTIRDTSVLFSQPLHRKVPLLRLAIAKRPHLLQTWVS